MAHSQRSLSKNMSSGVFGFRNKGIYEDVFVSRPKMRAPAFTPGVKDYAEIFNCLKPSSIPVLELDEFEKREEEVDYGNVFGGSFEEGKIGFSYEEVFGVGDRSTHDSHSHSRGPARPTAVEEGQKLPHEPLFEKKRSMSSDKINLGGKGGKDESNRLNKISEVPVPSHTFDGTVPLKKVSVSGSDATENTFKQESNEVPVRNHSRKASQNGLPKHGADISLDIDMKSRNGYASDKSVSSYMEVNNDIITPREQMAEGTAAIDSSMHMGGSMATSVDVFKQKSREEVHDGLNTSSQDVHVHFVDSPDNSGTQDSNKNECLAKHKASTSDLSSDLTHDHNSALPTPEVVTGNSIAHNSNGNENAKDDTYSYSQQDLKFQIKNSQVNGSDVRPQESSKPTPATHSQHSFSKINTTCEGNVIPEIIGLRNIDSESGDSNSNGFPVSNGKSKNEVEHADPALKKASSSKADVSKTNTYISVKDENSPCSSDDEINNHSEASVSAAAVKKAIKEAQALINIAKESNGVKGFMSFVLAKNSEQVKVVKEDQNSKAKESWKFCEPAQAETRNNSSTSLAEKDYNAPRPAGLKTRMAPAHLVVEEINLKGAELSTTDKPNQMKAVDMQTSLRENAQGSAPQRVSTFEEVAVNSVVDEKLDHRKDVAVHTIVADSVQVRLVPEASCSVAPNVEKGETEVNAAAHEAFLNNNPESYTVAKSNEAEKEPPKAVDNGDKGFTMHRFFDNLVRRKADCSDNAFEVKQEAVAVTEQIYTNQNKAMKVESEGHVSPDSTSLEEENVGESKLDSHDQVLDCEDMDSANSFEVKHDEVAVTEHIHTNQNEDIKVVSVGHVSPDSTSSEEENVEESKLDSYDQMLDFEDTYSANNFELKQDATAVTERIHNKQIESMEVENAGHGSSDSTLEEENVEELELGSHDQVSDCEDSDSQDYASAEENWVSTDSDDEISDKDRQFSAQSNLNEIEKIEHMVIPDVTVIAKDVLHPSHNNLHDDQIVKEIDDAPPQNILTKEAQVSEVKIEKTFLNSDENLVVEVTDKCEEMPLPNMVTCDAEFASEEVTAPMLNEDSIVEEADGCENVALDTMSKHEVKFTSEEKTLPFFKYSDEDSIVEDASVLFVVSPSATTTSEECASSCFNTANRDTSVETEGTENMAEQNIVTHEAFINSENDIAPCFDNSNEDWIVEENGGDPATKLGVSLHNAEHEGATGASKSSEQTTLNIEKLDCLARGETESESWADHESPHNVGYEAEPISTDDLAEESGAYAIEEFRPEPSTFVQEKHEADVTNMFNHDPRIQDREEFEQLKDAGVEADATEDGHETVNVEGFEMDHISLDASGEEDATETKSIPCDSESVDHELEAEVQFSEPLPDCSKHNETTEFEQLGVNFIQPVERQERRKWEMPRETFELPELETESPEIQDTMKQESIEMERQMDKHERKKWEIPVENFELPVLGDGDEVAEENDEHVRPEVEMATQSAEKPERKKWNIQKEVFEVPILCTEAVHDSPEHEGFVIKIPSMVEMGMDDNLSSTVILPEELVHCDEVQNQFSANEEAVPDETADCELRGENSGEIAKDRIPEIIMTSEEEIHTQLSENSDQQDTKVGNGKAVGQEDCVKGPEEVNVKEEIKRTLGMLWKKIYNVKQDEVSESVEQAGKEKVNFKDHVGLGIEKDLNLNGPVELVESPREQIDIETLIFSGITTGNEVSREDASFSEPFEVNESSTFKRRDFVSTNSPLAAESSEYHEEEKQSGGKETCDENYNASHLESLSEEVLSSSESDNWTEMPPTQEPSDIKKGVLECNILPSNIHEHGQTDSETDSGSKPLMPGNCSVDNAEIIKKAKVLQENGLNNAHEDISNANIPEVEVEMHRADDLPDKRCTNSEQQDTSSGSEDITSAPVSEAPDATLLDGIEQKADKNETRPDKIEQACSWKWIFGDDVKDKSNEQDEGPDLKLLREVKRKTKEVADGTNITNATKNEKINCDKPTSTAYTVPEPLHKEGTPDQKVLKDLMRAKEIERIAVERAIREARERAFIEAKERAAMEKANAEARERASIERANANAHQRETSNVQERFQRTSSETKLASEKQSVEAQRKAELERAAVERATSEARQRALEKAMSRKEQVTQSNISRSNSTASDQYGSSSNDDKPSESALRFKARNERHQRIAERAAKALAEKNMRDLLVQREQAERNRLAEVLDADVKRWARGKTGNLRALLSTLQYILGPDSGWQAIHLTEIVTADAVKKAYRKATLFVHPDKLQQRGATIRQKYICEKVFDLLKEAWNKFDRDER